MEKAIFERFSGERGDNLLIETVNEQKTVLGNDAAAKELCTRGSLKYFSEGESLTQEGQWSNSIIFIVAGRAEVSINGFKIAERTHGDHVGEMALIDPSQPRSATVVALEPTAGLVVSEADFAAVASHHPDMWRQLAKELARRLRERKKFIRPTNPKPYMFIACASESLAVAEAIKYNFEERGMVVEIWTDGVFKPSEGTFESLERKLEVVDFAIAIFSADDRVESRGAEMMAPRDNTVFELGLFAGAIGRERSFFVIQNGANVKVPSDLAGITSTRFGLGIETGEMPDIANGCEQIWERIVALGPR